MSVDYDAALAIGFTFDEDAFERAFGRTVPRESHMEDRYDPRTGEKVDPVEVLDCMEHEGLFLDGDEKEYGFDEELFEEISTRTRTHYVEQIDYDHTVTVTFGPTHEILPRPYENDCVEWRSLLLLGQELDQIATRLRELGLEPGEPTVSALLSCF